MTPLGVLLRLPRPVLRLMGGAALERDGKRMDAQSQLLNTFVQKLDKVPLEAKSPERARRDIEVAIRRSGLKSPSPSDDIEVPGPAGPIRVRVYTPHGAANHGPGVVFFHGGGWVIGSIESHDVTAGTLAEHVGCRVFSVDYRLAPEHPYPAAIDDAFAAVQAIASDERLSVDPDRLAVAGDSAGGNLAAAVSLRCRDEDAVRPAAQLLIYPGVDPAAESRSYETMAEGLLLTRAGVRWFISLYLPDAARRTEPYAAPLRAVSHADLPPAHIILAGFDPLHDEGLRYAQTLEAAGVAAECRDFPTTFHGFFGLHPALGVSNDAMTGAAAWLRRRLRLA